MSYRMRKWAWATWVGLVCGLSTIGWADTIFSYDFETTFPSFGYSYHYAGEGDPTCAVNSDSSGEISSSYDFSGPTATATLDLSTWDFPTDACWTYAGFGLGFGHVLPPTEQLNSGNVGDYTLSFDAWMLGTMAIGLDADLQIIFQAPDRDGDGNAEGYRLGVSNNTPSNTPLPFLTFTPQSFNINLADVAFWDSTWDFTTDFAETINVQLIIQPYGDASSIGVDADNVLYVDNLRLEGPLTSVTSGDFNGDGLYDCSDVDALVAVIAAGSHDAGFDLTGDALVNGDDLDSWLAEAGAVNLPSQMPHLVGDANLDGLVDVSDFNAWNNGKFTGGAGWCGGDFNADGVTDVSDFNLWNGNKFQSALAAVPESASLGVWMFASLALGLLGSRRRPRG